MTRRRFVITGAAYLASGGRALAQSPSRVFKLSIVHPDRSTKTMTRDKSPFFKAFFDELAKLGFVEGKNLIVDRFSGGGIAENYGRTAQETINSRPNVMLVASDRMTKLIKEINTNIPAVAITSDPIAYGLVRSLSHPGEMITGVMVNSSPEIFKKRIEFLKEIAPEIKGVFQLTSRTLWESPLGTNVLQAVQQSGLQLVGPPVESPHREAEYRAAFVDAAKHSHVALITTAVEHDSRKALIVSLINEFHMVGFYPYREYADIGGLIAHDVNMPDLFQHAAKQVASVLKGENVGDIPFYQPLHLKLIINLSTANASGVRLPETLLARADEIIE